MNNPIDKKIIIFVISLNNIHDMGSHACDSYNGVCSDLQRHDISVNGKQVRDVMLIRWILFSMFIH
jgi:hypothetical protein